MPPSRVILHADMDAFYASIEQRDDLALRGRPVIVGGTGPRGVVSAASYEAREFGVYSAMSSAEARQRCPQGVFLRGSMRRYAAESRRIFEVFQRFTPLVQGLSLDEAFLDLSGSERLLGAAVQVGERLRAEVRAETGLAVSVGIAPVKLVAKIASDLAKPDGLLEVPEGQVRDFLAPLPLRRLWGVGAVGEKRLREAGFATLGDAAIPFQVHGFAGECTDAEIARIVHAARECRAALVIGAGGGKVLDAARAAAGELEVPFISCPTIASTDAPCSAVSAIYDEEGQPLAEPGRCGRPPGGRRDGRGPGPTAH